MQSIGVRHEVSRPSTLAVGTMVWLASEVMFFGGFFAAYFSLRAAATTWPPRDVELDLGRAAFFTAVLVVSSATMHLGVRAVEQGDRRGARLWILATLAFGSLFLANQVSEWLGLGFTPASHSYGSVFYLLTGFHGLHVLGGLVAMAALLGRMASPVDDPGTAPVAQVVGYYWHFVDAVWLAVFATVFLVR
ncbi:MAG TPA: cytochrome c oxidase subunit 3 [Acidimicrobiales bacterium]|nr:cytochrome c oxidase subunit 3 [Acidimicrobiales bacterium]